MDTNIVEREPLTPLVARTMIRFHLRRGAVDGRWPPLPEWLLKAWRASPPS